VARTLHIEGLDRGTTRVWPFLFVALWNLAGCVVPPPEIHEHPNEPPTLDWSLTVPAEDQFTFQRREQQSMQFNIEGAVDDPEGDRLFTIWYWVDPEGAPHFLFGTLSMTFDNPCDLKSFFSPPAGAYVTVEVVVSDHEVTWAPTIDETQPVQTGMDEEGNPYPMIKRIWVVELVDTCP